MAAGLHPAHRLWRLLPAGARRAALTRTAALVAPRPDQPAPPARGGIAVGGELDRASGLGEGARLLLQGLGGLGVPCWALRAGDAPPPVSLWPEPCAATDGSTVRTCAPAGIATIAAIRAPIRRSLLFIVVPRKETGSISRRTLSLQ